jgi:hypothetical protein
MGERARYKRGLRGRRGSKARRREAKAWIGHSFPFDGATCKKWVFKKGLIGVLYTNLQHPYTTYILEKTLGCYK